MREKLSLILLFGVAVFLLSLVFPVSAIGVFRDSNGYWSLDYNNSGVVDKTFPFGKMGDIPLVGDWNGDSITDAGVFRPTTGAWYLDTTRSGVVSLTFQFGKSGDIPLAGNWNGDGMTDAGVFRPATGTWYLDTTRTGAVSSTFRFGKSGDIPVIGDWNGDGTTDAGVFRPATGTWYLDTTRTGVVSSTFQFGKAGDIPVIGDWNGDGTTDAGVFRPATGTWYLDTTRTGVVSSAFPFGKAGDIPVIGDWNADSTADAGVFRPSNGNWYLNYHKNTIADKIFQFGKAGDLPQVLQQPETLTLAPVAAFISDKQSGTAPLTVAFIDQSSGTAPLTYAWDFNNDGVTDSSEPSPSYQYNSAGTYTVGLTVSNAAGSNMAQRISYIIVSAAPVAPTAAFTVNKQSGTAPLTVAFTDQSTGTAPLTYAWDFANDEDDMSSQQNPSFTYSTAGTYSVKLTVTNAAGSDEEIKSGYITVTLAPVAPAAAFTSNKQSGTAPLTVAFTDQSTGTAPLTYAWDFNNDGTRDSTSQNPSFTFQNPGTYTVKLTVTNALGSDGETKNGYITVTPPVPPTAAFTSNKQSGAAPLTVRFTDQSTGTTPLTFAWDFTNDGTTDSTSQNPSFTYPAAGTYTVRLTTTNAVGSDAEIKTGYITVMAVPTAAFTADIQSGTAPLTVAFTDHSTGSAPLTYAWDFTNDGTRDSTSQNPSFTYQNPGTYTVKLTATNAVGSDVETKTGYITVTELPVAPVAAFITDTQTGYTPLTVRFTDQSTGTSPLSYEWDFDDDGITDSTGRNPSFIYTTAGTYSVNFTVTNPLGSDSELKSSYITVNPTIAPTAAFTADIQSGDAPLMVRFTDQSSGTAPLTYAWDFRNDGTPDSTTQNPLYTYTTPGTYTVKLTVTNAAGSDIRTETDYITVTEPPVSATSGIALTFDDNYVDQWYAARGIFQQYDAHVTFYVSQYDGLDEDQINKLRALEADGHEIAFHGLYHTDAATYLETHTIQQYLDYEIIPGINLMKADGFNPVDFSYPFGSGYDNDQLANALEQYFIHLRDTTHGSVYYQYGSGTPMIHAQGIDDTTYGQSLDDIYNYISTAKANDEIVIFYCHEPVPANPGSYQISYDRLDKILKYVSDNGLKTFTISEIH